MAIHTRINVLKPNAISFLMDIFFRFKTLFFRLNSIPAITSDSAIQFAIMNIGQKLYQTVHDGIPKIVPDPLSWATLLPQNKKYGITNP